MSTEGHADLVGKECREVRFLRGIVPREGADVSPVLLRTLLGQEPKRTVARCLKFTVRHGTKSGQKSSGGWWVVAERATSKGEKESNKEGRNSNTRNVGSGRRKHFMWPPEIRPKGTHDDM